MEFDIDVVQDILEECEKKCDGIKEHLISGEIKQGSSFNSTSYHCKLLINEGFLDGRENRSVPFRRDGISHKNEIPTIFSDSYKIDNLTLKGQGLLYAIKLNVGLAHKTLGFNIKN